MAAIPCGSASRTWAPPVCAAWLGKLERYRMDPMGMQRYAYRVEMFPFLRRYDVILCPADA